MSVRKGRGLRTEERFVETQLLWRGGETRLTGKWSSQSQMTRAAEDDFILLARKDPLVQLLFKGKRGSGGGFW